MMMRDFLGGLASPRGQKYPLQLNNELNVIKSNIYKSGLEKKKLS